jgi:hypothetical protein
MTSTHYLSIFDNCSPLTLSPAVADIPILAPCESLANKADNVLLTLIKLLTNTTHNTKLIKDPPRGDQAMSRMRGERLQIMLSPEELTVLDDFRFK